MITIYESEDEVKLEENLVDTHTPHRRQADNGDFELVPSVRRRLMLDDRTPPVEETRRPPPLPDQMYIGQTQREIRRAAYVVNRARPQYEYIEPTTFDSESSQCPDPDSSDDNGHRDCGLGGYEYCPDNPANYRTTQHREDDSNENHPDTSDRGIT